MSEKKFDLSNISKYREELYGIAILLIMYFHYAGGHVEYYSDHGGNSLLFTFNSFLNEYIGSIGVEIFVFLSGMSMYYSFSRNPDVLGFYRKRLRRLLIPYLYVACAFWIMKDVAVLHLGWSRVLADISFYTFFTEGVKTIWFILFLIIAYALMPVIYGAIFGNHRTNTIAAAVMIIVLMMIPVLIRISNEDLYRHTEIAITRFPLFVAGVYSGKYIREGKHVSHLYIGILFAAAGILKYYEATLDIESYTSRYIASLFGVALIFLFTYLLIIIDKAQIIRRILRFFGKYSLELYMLHVTMRNLMGTMELQPYRTGRYALMAVITIILSPCLHWLAEKTNELIKI